MAKILVYARMPEEREFLYEACRKSGVVYVAPDADKAASLLAAIPFAIAVIDAEEAAKPELRDKLAAVPLLFLAGRDEAGLRNAARAYPPDR
ncbi:MAG: hypothetical protein PHI34_11730, partial [Acidobacteriota bacterium]|nr:hypothetical protein [Acidobacteriota bacterium]